MNFIETPIKGLIVIEPKIWKDDRGYFYESYNEKLFKEAGIDTSFVQDNQSYSQKGTLRGLHAQANPFAQGKLVRVIQGKVLDVAVDIRKDSPTYGQYFSVELSGENFKMFWVPPGFLHGFITLEDNTIFSYKVTGLYDKASELGVLWNDPDLNIDWKFDTRQAILSEKDKQLISFKEFNSPF
ncbi:dTDP-4-dehydrorhamnose 3,5-epimerase [Pseudopedobacter saltans DSM 12145]|uniref:dTDP-4-dehydrorhamnose 3,5-epimerase n=1 Tax=Pseudopedobacter saltans (strain ATCC 51119 / DSM 12145 / JCM 21818 / CCUG 39354 / LMG 10337 / NBRC 100064 / NCIMB 13643) TaxID=762903 RepID=F0S5I7_PSESL|nr:dTDP-4-dehydrorhamnose 3,5-epimerase [Pseudopedobacter saltans]ADY53151.1 dTDP-4-dehydrorhamnose 3,5-epimerase [Pseudopedobacter saltans DSM 12145]